MGPKRTISFLLFAAALVACGENLLLHEDDLALPKETATGPDSPNIAPNPAPSSPSSSADASSDTAAPSSSSEAVFLGSCAWGVDPDFMTSSGLGCSYVPGHAVATFYQAISGAKIFVHNRIENSPGTICEAKTPPANVLAFDMALAQFSDVMWTDPPGPSGVTVNWMKKSVVQEAMDGHNALEAQLHPGPDRTPACWLARSPNMLAGKEVGK